MNFYIAQISGAIAWILLFISYWKNGNNKILYLQVLSCLFFALNYSLLGAISGLLVVIFEMIRDFLYTKVKDPNKLFIITIPIYLIISIFSFEGFISLFSIFASLLDAYALTKKNKKVVVLGILTYILWLIYDIEYASYSTIVAESILIISNFMVLLKYNFSYLKSNKLVFSRGMTINTKIIDEFEKINSSNFDSNYNWSKDKAMKVLKDNKTDIIYIRDEDEIIGYIQFIKISEDKYNEILNSKDEYIDLETQDIKRFIRNKNNYLSIFSIAIQLHYQNDKTIDLVSKFIKEYIYRKNRLGYRIKGITGNAVSEYENKIFKKLKFKKETNEINKHYIYTLPNEVLKEYTKKIVR